MNPLESDEYATALKRLEREFSISDKVDEESPYVCIPNNKRLEKLFPSLFLLLNESKVENNQSALLKKRYLNLILGSDTEVKRFQEFLVGEEENRRFLMRLELEAKFVYGREVGQIIALYARGWMEEKNPFYGDFITLLCKEQGMFLSPKVSEVLAQISEARLEGGCSGTAEKIKKNQLKEYALIVMLNLIYAGDTLEKAASKAAHHVKTRIENEGLCVKWSYKASTLEKDYTKYFGQQIMLFGKKAKREEHYFECWDRYKDIRKDNGLEAYWQLAKANLPLADDDLTGVRR